MKKKKLKKQLAEANRMLFAMDERMNELTAMNAILEKDVKEEKAQKELWMQRCKRIKKEKEEKRKYEVHIDGGYW